MSIIAAVMLAVALPACSEPGTNARPAAAGRASPAAVPVRVQAGVVGWSGMVQRPEHIYVGMGGAPVVRQLAWRDWGGPRASAGGKLDLYWPQRGPISGWHPTTYAVTVRLQGILVHNGQPSYREMAYFYVNRRGVAKVLRFSVLRSARRISSQDGTWARPRTGRWRRAWPDRAFAGHSERMVRRTQLQSDTAWVVGGIRTLADASDPEDLKAVTALQSPARDPGTLIIPGCCNRVWRLARET